MDIIEAIGAIGGTLKLLLGLTAINGQRKNTPDVFAREARSLSWEDKVIELAGDDPELLPRAAIAIVVNENPQIGKYPKKLPVGKGLGVVDTPEELDRLASLRYSKSRNLRES